MKSFWLLWNIEKHCSYPETAFCIPCRSENIPALEWKEASNKGETILLQLLLYLRLISGKLEPYLPRFTQIRRSACSVSVIVFMVVLVLAALVGVVIYRAAVGTILSAQSYHIIQSKTLAITAATASLLNLVAITVMSKVNIISHLFFHMQQLLV